MKTGALQTARDIEDRLNEQFEIIYARAEAANLSEPSMDRIEKAQRAFAAIVCYLRYFFTIYSAFVAELHIEQEKFFNEVIFPLPFLGLWDRVFTAIGPGIAANNAFYC